MTIEKKNNNSLKVTSENICLICGSNEKVYTLQHKNICSTCLKEIKKL